MLELVVRGLLEGRDERVHHVLMHDQEAPAGVRLGHQLRDVDPHREEREPRHAAALLQLVEDVTHHFHVRLDAILLETTCVLGEHEVVLPGGVPHVALVVLDGLVIDRKTELRVHGLLDRVREHRDLAGILGGPHLVLGEPGAVGVEGVEDLGQVGQRGRDLGDELLALLDGLRRLALLDLGSPGSEERLEGAPQEHLLDLSLRVLLVEQTHGLVDPVARDDVEHRPIPGFDLDHPGLIQLHGRLVDGADELHSVDAGDVLGEAHVGEEVGDVAHLEGAGDPEDLLVIRQPLAHTDVDDRPLAVTRGLRGLGGTLASLRLGPALAGRQGGAGGLAHGRDLLVSHGLLPLASQSLGHRVTEGGVGQGENRLVFGLRRRDFRSGLGQVLDDLGGDRSGQPQRHQSFGTGLVDGLDRGHLGRLELLDGLGTDAPDAGEVLDDGDGLRAHDKTPLGLRPSVESRWLLHTYFCPMFIRQKIACNRVCDRSNNNEL